MVEFALVVPLLVVVVTAVLRIGAWLLDMAEADAAAHTAARAAARSPEAALQASVRRELPHRSDVRVSREIVSGLPSVRVEIPVSLALPGWEVSRSAVAVEAFEPR